MTRLTCPERFAERGDAWVTPREQEDLQAELKPREATCVYSYETRRFESTRRAAEKPRYRDPAIPRRPLTDAEKQADKVRENMLAIRQLAGLKPRDLKPLGGGAARLGRIYHPSKEEMIGDPATIAAAADKERRDWEDWRRKEREEREERRRSLAKRAKS